MSCAGGQDMSPERLRQLNELLDTWNRDTSAHSSFHAIMAHPNVALIREYGTDALPVFLRRLESTQSHPDGPEWNATLLLSEMAGDEIEVAEEQRGCVDELVKLWLEWGKSRGHI